MTEKYCKKCGKLLPDGYKGKKCEHCMNQLTTKIKKVTKVIGATLVAVGGIAIVILNRKDKM